MRTLGCVETSGAKYLMMHLLCLGSSTLEYVTVLMVPLRCFRVHVAQMLEFLA